MPWLSRRATLGARLKRAVEDFEGWDGLECSQIDLLPVGAVRVIWVSAYLSGEITDLADGVFWEKYLCKFLHIQPLEPGVTDGAAVEVVAINVDVSFQPLFLKTETALETASTLPSNR